MSPLYRCISAAAALKGYTAPEHWQSDTEYQSELSNLKSAIFQMNLPQTLELLRRAQSKWLFGSDEDFLKHRQLMDKVETWIRIYLKSSALIQLIEEQNQTDLERLEKLADSGNFLALNLLNRFRARNHPVDLHELATLSLQHDLAMRQRDKFDSFDIALRMQRIKLDRNYELSLRALILHLREDSKKTN